MLVLFKYLLSFNLIIKKTQKQPEAREKEVKARGGNHGQDRRPDGCMPNVGRKALSFGSELRVSSSQVGSVRSASQEWGAATILGQEGYVTFLSFTYS